jgi:exodeoxyribonuclease V gamma subunit
LSLADLERFLKQPVTQFFRQRLKVDFKDTTSDGEDDEPFTLDGLDGYLLDDELLADSGPHEPIALVPERLQQRAEKLAREGRLPIGHLGALWQRTQVDELIETRSAWITLCAYFFPTDEHFPISVVHGSIAVNDWLDNARHAIRGPVWLERTASKITTVANKEIVARPDKMVRGYLRQLALAACDYQLTGYLVGRDAILELPAMQCDAARTELHALLTLWQQGMSAPLPTAFKTALALLADDTTKAKAAYDGTHFGNRTIPGESAQPALARLWPDYAAMQNDPAHAEVSRQLVQPLLQWTQGIKVHALSGVTAITKSELDAA